MDAPPESQTTGLAFGGRWREERDKAVWKARAPSSAGESRTGERLWMAEREARWAGPLRATRNTWVAIVAICVAL